MYVITIIIDVKFVFILFKFFLIEKENYVLILQLKRMNKIYILTLEYCWFVFKWIFQVISLDFCILLIRNNNRSWTFHDDDISRGL